MLTTRPVRRRKRLSRRTSARRRQRQPRIRSRASGWSLTSETTMVSCFSSAKSGYNADNGSQPILPSFVYCTDGRFRTNTVPSTLPSSPGSHPDLGTSQTTSTCPMTRPMQPVLLVPSPARMSPARVPDHGLWHLCTRNGACGRRDELATLAALSRQSCGWLWASRQACQRS